MDTEHPATRSHPNLSETSQERNLVLIKTFYLQIYMKPVQLRLKGFLNSFHTYQRWTEAHPGEIPAGFWVSSPRRPVFHSSS